MGNYCCSEQNQEIQHLPIFKKKVTLQDPCIKRKYEEDLTLILNSALTKFSENKSVVELCIKGQLGKGGQGAVFFVQLTQLTQDGLYIKHNYAMKRVPKKKLDMKRTRQALLLEKEILISNQSYFLTQIQYAFQDQSYLYYLMEIAQGGDLLSLVRNHFHLNAQKTIVCQQKGLSVICFILAGVVLGLEYLHQRDIIYRDLKPENILIFEDGYPKLADFGIAKKFKHNQLCYDIKGTIIYFSPEMTTRRGYDRGVDFWALGVLAYELLLNEPPFSVVDINSKNFQQKCIQWQNKPVFHQKIDPVGENFIKKLLRVDPEQRLGYNSFDEIKADEFFSSIDWQAYQEKKVESPLRQVIDLHPITLNLSSQLKESLEIDERQYLPFTFVKNIKTAQNSCASCQKLQWLQRSQTLQQ